MGGPLFLLSKRHPSRHGDRALDDAAVNVPGRLIHQWQGCRGGEGVIIIIIIR